MKTDGQAKSSPNRNIVLFVATTYLLISTVALVFRALGGEYDSVAGMVLAAGCMVIPLLATLVSQRAERKPLLHGIGISLKLNRWWLIGWLLMPVAALLALLYSWLLDSGSFTMQSEMMQQAIGQSGLPAWALLVVSFVSSLFAGITINGLFAFGEEVGWRGYLLRQFVGRRFLVATLVIGLVWGLWHAPIVLMGHNYPHHPVAGVFMMMAICVFLSAVFQYIRIKSGSVIVAAIMHGTFNALAGISLLFYDNPNDLLVGAMGLAGLLAMLTVATGLFVYDRFVSKERLFTSILS